MTTKEQLSEEQLTTLKLMLVSYKYAYDAAKSCDGHIDEAIANEVEFADSDEPIEDYLEIQGGSSRISKSIMKLSNELKREIDRITEMINNNQK